MAIGPNTGNINCYPTYYPNYQSYVDCSTCNGRGFCWVEVKTHTCNCSHCPNKQDFKLEAKPCVLCKGTGRVQQHNYAYPYTYTITNGTGNICSNI